MSLSFRRLSTFVLAVLFRELNPTNFGNQSSMATDFPKTTDDNSRMRDFASEIDM